MLMMLPRQEYEDDEEEYYYYDYEPESSCPPGELKVQVFFACSCFSWQLLWRWIAFGWILGGLRG